jgi:hypothetical protein
MSNGKTIKELKGSGRGPISNIPEFTWRDENDETCQGVRERASSTQPGITTNSREPN